MGDGQRLSGCVDSPLTRRDRHTPGAPSWMRCDACCHKMPTPRLLQNFTRTWSSPNSIAFTQRPATLSEPVRAEHSPGAPHWVSGRFARLPGRGVSRGARGVCARGRPPYGRSADLLRYRTPAVSQVLDFVTKWAHPQAMPPVGSTSIELQHVPGNIGEGVVCTPRRP